MPSHNPPNANIFDKIWWDAEAERDKVVREIIRRITGSLPFPCPDGQDPLLLFTVEQRLLKWEEICKQEVFWSEYFGHQPRDVRAVRRKQRARNTDYIQHQRKVSRKLQEFHRDIIPASVSPEVYWTSPGWRNTRMCHQLQQLHVAYQAASYTARTPEEAEGIQRSLDGNADNFKFFSQPALNEDGEEYESDATDASQNACCDCGQPGHLQCGRSFDHNAD